MQSQEFSILRADFLWMESQPQNLEFRNNPENFHPRVSTFNLVCSFGLFNDIFNSSQHFFVFFGIQLIAYQRNARKYKFT